MRGLPKFNFPAFDYAAAHLRKAGFEVFSPAENDRKTLGSTHLDNNATGDEDQLKKATGFSIRDALRDDTHYICVHADGIALLPGWEKSAGARAEHALAQALGHTVIILGEYFIEGNDRPAAVPAEGATAIFDQTDKQTEKTRSYDPKRMPWSTFPQAPALSQAKRNKSLLDGMDSARRKEFPVTTGCFDYFRDALLAVSHMSFKGNQKHNPGEPLHWARGKSADEPDAMGRHLLERDEIDPLTKETVRVQLAWRALADLQKFLEAKYNIEPPRGCR